jgi:AcrR family transcriptional regulator
MLKQDAKPDARRSDTRVRLLDAAENAVLEKGLAATSIEELIAEVGITKSGFFYHFKDKGVLAAALVDRYIERENDMLDDLFARAQELHEDPLHGFLVGLKLFSEMLSDLPNGHPGCLVASVVYQEQLFRQDVRDRTADAVLGWRIRFRAQLDLIAEKYPPKIDVDLDDLADMISVLVDGGIILSKAVRDPKALPRQVMLFRSYLQAIFLGTAD